MSLRRKLIFKDGALLASLSLMIGGVMWGLARQRSHVQASLAEYDALRRVEVAQARYLVYRQTGNPVDLEAARVAMREYKAVVSVYDTVLPPEIDSDQRQDVKTRTKLLLVGLNRISTEGSFGTPADGIAAEFAGLSAACTGFVNRTSAASAADLRAAVLGVSGMAAVTMLIAVGSTVWQYRRVAVPLAGLRDWCRRTAGGDFSTVYVPTDDREFVDLGRDVNRMAVELSAFYRRLEEMVATKSRQLAQSQRLASVGFLAAGVAHEINTPLNVMSGYAELLIKRLRRANGDDEAVANLEVIRAEAFRCKEITQKLLSLARGGGGGRPREVVSVTSVVAEVAAMVGGLGACGGKSVHVTTPVDDLCDVRANPNELKQVLLNLIVNGTEAVGDGPGRVSITTTREDESIVLTVCDDGRGMDGETVDRVFEPFFTAKRGVGNPGTGLGLSITHTIVTDHGGDIAAHSDGPGRGSTFTVRLPAAVTVAAGGVS